MELNPPPLNRFNMWPSGDGDSPLGGALLEGVDDLAIVAELADEALLAAQAAAVHVRAGKLNHLGEEGGQLPIDHLLTGRARESERGGDEMETDGKKKKKKNELIERGKEKLI